MSTSSPSASASTTISPALFPEVIDIIVRDRSLHTSDIRHASLISRDWLEPSQRRLFCSVRLDPEREHPIYHIDPKSNSARLIWYIKHLTLFTTSTDSWIPFPCDNEDDALVRIDEDPELIDDDYFNTSAFIGHKLGGTHIQMVPDPEACNSTHPGFLAFLHKLTRLETLTVRNRLNWYLLKPNTIQAFFHIFSLDTFRCLDIWRGSAIRFPFIFLHFCPNLEYLSLNVRPTTLLDVKGIDTPKCLALRGRPPIRPTTLKLIGANVVHSVKHYVDIDQANIGNTFSLDRLRSLYIAYHEDPLDAVEGGIWPSKRVGEFLSSFGHNVEELILEVDHRSTTSRAASAVPEEHLSKLTNLTHLNLYIYNGVLPELDFNECFSWLFPFLKGLPNPSNLTTFQLMYASSFKWTDSNFDNTIRVGEDFLEELFDILSSSFVGLKAVKVQMKLSIVNGPWTNTLPPCNLLNRSDYNGLVTLTVKQVHVHLCVALLVDYNKELN